MQNENGTFLASAVGALAHGLGARETQGMSENPNTASAEPLWRTDLDAVRPENIAEMLRVAEIRSEAVYRAALGMDQRAAVLAAGFAAAAGALMAAALATSSAEWQVFSFCTGGLMALAAALCCYVCRPQPSHFPGVMPIVWHWTPSYLTDPLHEARMAMAATLQDQLAINERKAVRNGRVLSVAMILAGTAPFVGILAAFNRRLAQLLGAA